MTRVELKSKGTNKYYLTAISEEDVEMIKKILEETNTLYLDGYPIEASQICMYGTTHDVSEEQARMYVPKLKYDISRREKREEFVKNLATQPILTVDAEYNNYTCYAYKTPGEHKSPLSGFRCALEQLNYPRYVLLYVERDDNGTV